MTGSQDDQRDSTLTNKHSSKFVSAKNIITRLLLVLIIAFPPILQTSSAYSQDPVRKFLLDNGINLDPNIKVKPNKGIVLQPAPRIACLNPMRPNAAGTKCVCPSTMRLRNNKCVPKIVQIGCLFPFTPNAAGTKCVCPAGQKKRGNTCVPKGPQLACLFPFTPNASGTKCVCPAGQKPRGNTCVAKGPQLGCLIPFTPNAAGTKCVCPAGLQKRGNTCVPINIQILCQAPFVPNRANTRCVCPTGLEKRGNRCVQIQAAPVCNFPFVYSSRRDSCVCAKGYRLNNSGNRCIRKQAAPATPTVSRATIREIQACLSRLGYEAGAADGQIGRRTRTAWGNFRIDQGLQGRANNFSDAVTQDRLFQACANVNQPAPQPVPDPIPQPEPEEDAADENDTNISGAATNFDSEEGYPALQCVSANLLETFESMMPEGEEIGICGQTCVPIPAGMSPAQISSTGETVNWCRNCATLGEAGLICTQPARLED